MGEPCCFTWQWRNSWSLVLSRICQKTWNAPFCCLCILSLQPTIWCDNHHSHRATDSSSSATRSSESRPKNSIYHQFDFTSQPMVSNWSGSTYWYGCKWGCEQPTFQNSAGFPRNGSNRPASPPLSTPTKTSDTPMRQPPNWHHAWKQPLIQGSSPCMDAPVRRTLSHQRRSPITRSWLLSGHTFWWTDQTPSTRPNQSNKLHVPKYCKTVIQRCNKHRLDEQIVTLLTKTELLPDKIQELELIDETLTKILVQMDQQCQPLLETPWSPAVQTAYMIHWYWSLKLTAKRTECDLSASFEAIEKWLEPHQLQIQPSSTISSNLWKAQKHLKQAKREADQLQQKHLEALLNQAIAANQQQNWKL